jgi:predicted Holliday junction resolvase-like endonuclease
MRKPSRELITELQRNRQFMATCPVCRNEFRLADATLFSLKGKTPEAAIQAINEARQAIKERRAELAKARERMTKRAEITAQSVNLGKIVEKIVPSFPTFPYSAGDCRALFDPIDYLVFSGLAKRGQVEALYFVDVKSGSARLTKVQRCIKDVVEAGALKFSVTRG